MTAYALMMMAATDSMTTSCDLLFLHHERSSESDFDFLMLLVCGF